MDVVREVTAKRDTKTVYFPSEFRLRRQIAALRLESTTKRCSPMGAEMIDPFDQVSISGSAIMLNHAKANALNARLAHALRRSG